MVILVTTLCLLLIVSGAIGFYDRKVKMAPLTKKGEKIKKALQKEYGKKKGTSILYAMENKGTVKGVTKKTGKKKTSKKK